MADTPPTRTAVAPADLSRSFLRVEGADAIPLLDGLITQDIAGMPDHHARFGMFLTAKARILAPALVYRMSHESILLEVPVNRRADLVTHLRRYRLRAAAEVSEWDAGRVLVIDPAPAGLPREDWMSSAELGDHPAWAWVGSVEECATLFASIGMGTSSEHAAEQFHATRIARGVPGFPDFAIDYMPAEVGADVMAVSFTKGCYLGQEPVARLHWRGRAQRTLRQLHLSVLPEPGADAIIELAPHDGSTRAAGVVTSWATQSDGIIRALGVIRRDVPRGAVLHDRSTAITAIVLDDVPDERPAE